MLGQRGLSRVMSTGVLVSLAGYLVLAFAPTIPAALFACALLLSLSGTASMFGSLLAGIDCGCWGAAATLGLSGLGFAGGWGLVACTEQPTPRGRVT